MPSLSEASVRYATYYANLALATNDMMTKGGDELKKGIDAFDLEWTNILSTMRLAHAHANWEAVVRLSVATLEFCRIRSNAADWQEIGKMAIDAARQMKDPGWEARASGNLAHFFLQQGQWSQALQIYKRIMEIFQSISSEQDIALTLLNIANVYLDQGHLNEATEHLQQALQMFRKIEDHRSEASVISNLGIIYRSKGELDRSMEMQKQALEIYRSLGDWDNEAMTLRDIGLIYAEQSHWDDAIDFYNQSASMFHRLGDKRGEAMALSNLGNSYAKQERWNDATEAFQTGLNLARETKDGPTEQTLLKELGNLYWQRGQLDEAAQLYEKALSIVHALGDLRGKVSILHSLALIYEFQKRWADSEATYEQALQAYRELGDQKGEAETLGWSAMLSNVQGTYSIGANKYEAALQIYRDLGISSEIASTLGSLRRMYKMGERWTELVRVIKERLEFETEPLTEKDKVEFLVDLGEAYEKLKDWDNARQSFSDALLITKTLGDRNQGADLLRKLAGIYESQDKNSEVIECLKESLSIYKETNNSVGQATVARALGELYAKENKWGEAHAYFAESESSALDSERVGSKTESQIDLANFYWSMGQWDKFLESVRASLKTDLDQFDKAETGGEGESPITKERIVSSVQVTRQSGSLDDKLSRSMTILATLRGLSDTYGEGLCLAYIGLIYAQYGRTEEAVNYLRQALRVLTPLDVPEIQKVMAWLSQMGADTPSPVSDAPGSSPQSKVSDFTIAGSTRSSNLLAPTSIFVGRETELSKLKTMLEENPGKGPVLALISGPRGVGKSTLVAQVLLHYGRSYPRTITLSRNDCPDVESILRRLGEILWRLGKTSILENVLPDPELTTAEKARSVVSSLNEVGPTLVVLDDLERIQLEGDGVKKDEMMSLLRTLVTELRGRAILVSRESLTGLLSESVFAGNLLSLELDDFSTADMSRFISNQSSLAKLTDEVRNEIVEQFGGIPFVYELLSSNGASQNLDMLLNDVRQKLREEREKHNSEEWTRLRRRQVESIVLDAIITQLPANARSLLFHLCVLTHSFPTETMEQGLGVIQSDWQPLVDWRLLRHDPSDSKYYLHSAIIDHLALRSDPSDSKITRLKLADWYRNYGRNVSGVLSDLVEAYQMYFDAGAIEQAGEIARELAIPLAQFGSFDLARSLLSKIANQDEDKVSADAKYKLGILAEFQGKYDEAQAIYEEVLNTYERLDDLHGRAATLGQLGGNAQRQGHWDAAEKFMYECLKAYENLKDDHGRAEALHNLGVIQFERRNNEEAKRFYDEALVIRRQTKDELGIATTLGQLGGLARVQGDLFEARRLCKEASDSFEHLGYQHQWADAQLNLGLIAEDLGELDKAENAFSLALATFERLGNVQRKVKALIQLGKVMTAQGEYEKARIFLNQALHIVEQRNTEEDRGEILNHFGIVAREQGNLDEARRFLNLALDAGRRLQDNSQIFTALYQLVKVALLGEKFREAHQLINECLNLMETLGERGPRYELLYYLGVIAEKEGENPKAETLYRESIALNDEQSGLGMRGATLARLGGILQGARRFDEAKSIYADALLILRQTGDDNNTGAVLASLGTIAQHLGDYQEARRRDDEALEIFARINDKHNKASVLHNLGQLAQLQGDYEEAKKNYTETLSVLEPSDYSRRSSTLFELGTIAYMQGMHEESQIRYAEALDLVKAHGDTRTQAIILDRLGTISREQGKLNEASALFKEALVLYELDKDIAGRGLELHNLGTIAQYQRKFDEAQELLCESLEIRKQLSDLGNIATTLGQLGLVALDQKDHRLALEYTMKAWSLFNRLRAQEGNDYSSEILREIQRTLGETTFRQYWNSNVDDLGKRLVNFLNAQTLAESKQLIESQPDLIGAQADNLLTQLAANQEQESARDFIEKRRQLLTRCAEVGISNAYHEIQSTDAQDSARENARKHSMMGDDFYNQGNYEQAISHYQKAAEIDLLVTNWNNFGNAHLSLGHLDEAITAYEKAIEIAPRDAIPLRNLGLVHERMQQFEEATADWVHAINLNPRWLTPYEDLIRVCGHIGAETKALEYCERAINIAREASDRLKEVQAMDTLSLVLDALGKREAAIAQAEIARDLYKELNHENTALMQERLDRWRDAPVA